MGAKKTTILAVDDEPRLLKFVAFNLESEGYAVLRSNSTLPASLHEYILNIPS